MKEKYSAIYTPKGLAREYGALAVNLYKGCRHGCRYCWVPGVLHKAPKDFHAYYGPRERITDMVEKDLAEMQAAGDNRRVLLCFTCDPYQGDTRSITTRETLELFAKYGRNFQVLTKGGVYPTADFDLYKPGDLFAATLTFMDSALSREWEPNAPTPGMRIEGLQEAAKRGIYTWVSFEPVIIPEQTLALYEATKEHVREYRIGKLNYMDPPAPIDYEAFVAEMIERCARDGKKLYIKESLRAYAPEGYEK